MRFNVRVYGLLVHDDRLLLADEFISGRKITKLPGGGLEFGEGTRDCLAREFKEECNLNVEVLEHFYTTDFYVTSAFSTQSQIISIYYKVRALEEIKLKTSNKKFDFKTDKEGEISFRWKKVEDISENDFTFVIDKKVASLINQ